MIRPSSTRCAWMLALAGLIRVLYPRRWPPGRLIGVFLPGIGGCETPETRTRVFSFEGVTDVAFGFMQCQADLCEPQAQKLLTMLNDATVFMEDHAVISIGNDTGLRVDSGDGLVHAVQGYQGQHGEIVPLGASLRP